MDFSVFVYIYFPFVTSDFITFSEKSFLLCRSVNLITMHIFLSFFTVKESQPMYVLTKAPEPTYLKSRLESSV